MKAKMLVGKRGKKLNEHRKIINLLFFSSKVNQPLGSSSIYQELFFFFLSFLIVTFARNVDQRKRMKKKFNRNCKRKQKSKKKK